jgi:hypothetical protein
MYRRCFYGRCEPWIGWSKCKKADQQIGRITWIAESDKSQSKNNIWNGDSNINYINQVISVLT